MAPLGASLGKGRDSDKLTALSNEIPSKPKTDWEDSQSKKPHQHQIRKISPNTIRKFKLLL